MITFTILDSYVKLNEDSVPELKHVDISITDGTNIYLVGVGNVPLAGDIDAHLNTRLDELWRVAQSKQRPVDVLEHINERALLKALLGLMLSEINTLRTELGLQPRTKAQLLDALKTRLQ